MKHQDENVSILSLALTSCTVIPVHFELTPSENNKCFCSFSVTYLFVQYGKVLVRSFQMMNRKKESHKINSSTPPDGWRVRLVLSRQRLWTHFDSLQLQLICPLNSACTRTRTCLIPQALHIVVYKHLCFIPSGFLLACCSFSRHKVTLCG